MDLKVSHVGSLSRNFQIFKGTAFLLHLLESGTEPENVTA